MNGEYLAGCASVRCTGESYQTHTRVVIATPTAPSCLKTPCAVQYEPVVTIPSWAHRILRIPPKDSRMSYTKRESCGAVRIRLWIGYGAWSGPYICQRESSIASSYHLEGSSYNVAGFSANRFSYWTAQTKDIEHTVIIVKMKIIAPRLRKDASTISCTRLSTGLGGI